MSFMKDFDYLKIQMKDIVSATNNFDPTRVIGSGGFGSVYKGELSSPKGQITVAFKKLDRRHGQGNIEFWKEVIMLSKYKHENLICLMHFGIEGDEMALVYEYASRGSLDRYLSDASTLSWVQRLKICVGAARGLCFLHHPKETQQRVLHRDIKSSNILLDESWTAKISDFGLSKVGPANQAHTYLVSHGVGTPGYCDPLYMELGFLTKESDVYSFGVVLFEVLCGRLCYKCHNCELKKILLPKWRRRYDEKRLDDIILPGLKEQMDPSSLKSFSAVAYRCVKKAREERPTMAEIMKELEFSLEQQVIYDNTPDGNSREERTSLMLNGQMHQILDNNHQFQDRAAHIPPTMRGGAIGTAGGGANVSRMSDENYILRVSNLSEDTCEPDLLEPFGAFGSVSRAYVATDQKKEAVTVSRGVSYIPSHKSPFTAVQWQELEHQALIYKYLVAGVPVPYDLIVPIKRSLKALEKSKMEH